MIDAPPAFFTHRASGDAIVVLFVLVALACVAVFGFEDDYALHGWAGIGRRGRRRRQGAVWCAPASARARCPYLGVTLFALLAVTWFTVTPDFLAGED